MKKLIIIFLFLLPVIVNSQVHLGSTESEIRAMHPDKYFKMEYTAGGDKLLKSKRS